MTTANILSQLGSPGVSTGFKNRIINGAMVIAQRGTSFTYTNAVFPVDRFIGTCFGTVPTATISQSTTAPAGFINSVLLSITTGQALSSTDMHTISQNIEGLNLFDFNYGSASAVTSTLSFWVRSSLVGNYTVAVYNSLAGKWYSQPYTINVANTWEQKYITIVGDTASAINTNTSSGFRIDWVMGGGSAYNGTASQTWSASTPRQITGSQNITATTGATFYITGVQLEVGTTATNFEVRSYGTELALCQRYYESSYPLGYAPGYNFNEQYPFGSAQPACLNLIASDDTLTSGTAYFKVTKRASPSTIIYSPNNGSTNYTWSYRAAGAGNVAVSVPISQPNFVTFTQSLGAVDKANESYFLFVASAEL